MAYLIEGENHPVVYCANFRVGGTATGDTLVAMGGVQIGTHHAMPGNLPENTVVVQTVRNHFDVIASAYYRGAQPCDFDGYVNKILDGRHDWLCPDAFYNNYGKWDYILSYNTLQLEFDTMCMYAGLPCTEIKQSHTNRPVTARWQDLFTHTLRDKVAERYGEELERIGYGIS